MINGKTVDVDLPPSKTRQTPFVTCNGQPLLASDCWTPQPKPPIWGRPAGRTDDAARSRRAPWPSIFVRRPEPVVTVPEPSAALRRKLAEARLRLLNKKKQLAAGDAVSADVAVQCQMKAAPVAEGTVTMVRHQSVQADFTSDNLWTAPVVRAKAGVNVGTQVTHDQLVDFDAEALRWSELLTVTLLTEAAERVLYEDDAAALRRERVAIHRKRLTERANTMRLHRDEAERRCKALRALAEEEGIGYTYRAVRSRIAAEQYTRDMATDVVDELVSAGYLVDPHRIDPAQLLDGYADQFRRRERAEVPMDAMIGSVVDGRAQLHQSVAQHTAAVSCEYAYSVPNKRHKCDAHPV